MKVIQTETQDAVVAMEQETHAVEAGSASALRTGEVFNEISGIAQRSSELAETIASAAVNQTASTDQVGRSIKDFAGGARGDAESDGLSACDRRRHGKTRRRADGLRRQVQIGLARIIHERRRLQRVFMNIRREHFKNVLATSF